MYMTTYNTVLLYNIYVNLTKQGTVQLPHIKKMYDKSRPMISNTVKLS